MFEANGAELSFCRHFWEVDEAIDYCVMREGGLTRNLYELKKAHWNDLGDGLIRSKNGNHAVLEKDGKYFVWDFDLLPGETPEQNTLKNRNRDEEYNTWLKENVNAD